MSVSAAEFDLPQNTVGVDILMENFDKAEEIANSPSGITALASSIERMRTVRSSTSDQP